MVKTTLEVIRSLERKKWGAKEGEKEGRTITDQWATDDHSSEEQDSYTRARGVSGMSVTKLQLNGLKLKRGFNIFK